MTNREAINVMQKYTGDDTISPVVAEAHLMAIASLEKQEREKWHPLDPDDYPDDDRLIMVSFGNMGGVDIARYRGNEQGGMFYPGDEEKPYKSYGIYVNAWRELPEEYPVEVKGE